MNVFCFLFFKGAPVDTGLRAVGGDMTPGFFPRWAGGASDVGRMGSVRWSLHSVAVWREASGSGAGHHTNAQYLAFPLIFVMRFLQPSQHGRL